MTEGSVRGSGFAGSYKTHKMESTDANEQESDMMERLPTRAVESDATTDGITLVSLGCSCAPKLSFKDMGRGSETLPFDWVRTTMDGLMHFLANDFANFFEFNTDELIKLPNTDKTMHMFRSPIHSFWHDDPTMPSMLERYRRRIVRFNSLSAQTQPVLFVRAAASSEEVRCANLLVQLLVQRFGALASLLLIVDFQGPEAAGAIVVENEPNLMLHYFNTETGSAPHAVPIRVALDWVAGRKCRAMPVPSLEEAFKFLTPCDWGLQGTSGVWAFEGVESGPASIARTTSMEGPPKVLPPAREGQQQSDVLEKMKSKTELELEAARKTIPLVSLGCACSPKLSFKAMERGDVAYPFDWVRVPLQGVLHYVEYGFDDFFNYVTQQDVEVENMKTTFTMYRSEFHSFWYDDPRHLGMRETYLRRIAAFNSVDARSHPVLFVRAAATTEEILDAGRLARALVTKFGAFATLLLIIDCQGSEAPGPCVVDSEPNLMLHYCNTPAAQAPYVEPIAAALEWAACQPTPAMKVANLQEAMSTVKREYNSELYVSGVPIVEPGAHDSKSGFWTAHVSHVAGEGESDLMEKLPARTVQRDSARDAIQLISLGCSCGPKLSFKDIGRGAETLPLDWVRTRMSAVIDLLSTNFKGFYDYTTRSEIPLENSQKMIMFRGHDHSFWHDDPTEDSMRERYDRRIERLGRINAQQQGVLFVRALAASSELEDAGRLCALLIKKFGRFASLLLVIDFQGDDARGACVVDSEPSLMLYFLDTANENASAPYGKAVLTALDWVAGRPVNASKCQTMEEAIGLVKPTNWGLVGTGGVVAFESALELFPGS